MAYDASYLFKMAGGGANGLFLYLEDTDALATVVGTGYFDNAYDRLSVGDPIIFVDTNGGTVDLLFVSASSSAGVTVVNGT